MFDEVLKIPAIDDSVGTKTFLEFFRVGPDMAETRTIHDSVPIVNFSEPLHLQFRNQTVFWGEKLTRLDPHYHSLQIVEWFPPNFLKAQKGATSAYPPSRDVPFSPSSFDFGWADPLVDKPISEGLKQASAVVRRTAIEQGEPVDEGAPYGNYANKGYTHEEIFGSSLPRLMKIKARYDPEDVMALAGGWKVEPAAQKQNCAGPYTHGSTTCQAAFDI